MAAGKTNAGVPTPAKLSKYDNSGSGLAATNVQDAIDEVNENIPSSLPANGGDADTVDGKHASDFATAGHNHDADYAAAGHNHDSTYAPKSHNHTVSQITDFPDSLPADGGNADTVDGKHASDFASAVHTHNQATSDALGMVKIGYSENGNSYPVELDSNGKMFVNVPWTDTDTTYTSLKNPHSLKVQGNGTDIGSYDGSSAKTFNITPDNIGAAPSANGQYAVTTGGTGSAYTATVPGIAALTAGVSFIMIPNVVSESTSPTLNVNGLGAKSLKRRLSNLATSLQNGYNNTWLAAGKPFRVTYDGTAWIVEGHEKPAAADMYGLSASITELNYCEGVTSAIQAQLDNKAPLEHDHSDITYQQVFAYNFKYGYAMCNGNGVKRLVLDTANRKFAAGTEIELGTLPEAYRPSIYKIYHVFVMNASTSNQLFGRISIGTDGATNFVAYQNRAAGDDI
ncbi:MAG: hypothetical protein J6K99_04525, partial [Peptococcaceae bacterium]|nr:hypothetical protein [Peptococcaceae bacterium]